MLKASVKQYLPNRTIVAVIGALRDKDTDYMVHALADVFHHVITITPSMIIRGCFRTISHLAGNCTFSKPALI